MKLCPSPKVIITLFLVLALALVSIGCAQEAVVEEEEVAPPIKLVVEPSSANKIGAKVTVLGSGLTPGDTIDIKICMATGLATGELPVGVTYSLSPIPVVNDFGAFASTLTLTGYTAGIYTVQLYVDEEVVATAPLQVIA